MAGGLKATFIASYVHTVIIYIALCIFSLSVYATCPQLGSPGVVRASPKPNPNPQSLNPLAPAVCHACICMMRCSPHFHSLASVAGLFTCSAMNAGHASSKAIIRTGPLCSLLLTLNGRQF